MKSENQIIIRCKQLIKNPEAISVCSSVLTALVKEIFFRLFWCPFSVFIFLIPSKVIIIVIQFMFLVINIFWALLRACFNLCLMAWTSKNRGLEELKDYSLLRQGAN